MEAIVDNNYESELNEDARIFLKGSKGSRRILLSSDDEDCSGKANNETESIDKIQDEVSVPEHDDAQQLIREHSPSEEELNKILKPKKKNLIKKRFSDDSDSNDESEKSSSRMHEPNKFEVKDTMNDVSEPVTKSKWAFDNDIYDAEGSSDEDQRLRTEPDVEENNISKNRKKKKEKTKNKILDSDIYDAEGSDEEPRMVTDPDEVEESVHASKNNKKESKEKTKRSNYQRKSKQTALEEIHSETQRLIRQSRVSLPYHRPKQRTLSEFLNRRKSLPMVPLKTTTDQLSKVWVQIEEREKTAESFYKSDSDRSDDESMLDPANENVSDVNKSLTNDPIINQECSHNPHHNPATDIQIDKNIADDITLNLESSLDLNLHYTETETPEFSENCEVILEDPMKIEYPKNIKECESADLSESKNNTTSGNTLVERKISSDSDVIDGLSAEKDTAQGDIHNHSSISSDVTTKESIPKTSSCAEEIFKNDIVKPSCADHIDALVFNDDKNDDRNLLNKSSKILPNNLLDRVPRLSGQPDEVIDFEKSPEKPGAVKLISRFMKHITLKPKVKAEENIVVAISEVNENGEIVSLKEETVKIKRNKEILELRHGDSAKPGETRMKLKERLQHKIAKCREEQFAKRLEDYKLNEEEMFDDDKLLDEEDEELIEDEDLTPTESESDSDMEDDLKEDVIKEKNPFVDEEAEESENDDVETDKERLSDAEEYSEAPSVDVGSLVEKGEDLPDFGSLAIGPQNSQGNGLIGLCSGAFASQPFNIDELEKDDISPSQTDIDTKSLPSHKNEECQEKIVSDVDDDSDEDITVKKKKKSKLSFSDDEEDLNEESLTDPPESEGEVQENNDSEDDENENDELSGQDQEIVYEEDEEMAEYEAMTKKAAKRFLEAEAELSGSEWGSADEDEVDLDLMEKEEGDDDVLNQKKVISELGKIHMKELLDEDQREIRVLQELFLEDGDLHSDGPKRERQFRWYNQDGENDNGSFGWYPEGEEKNDVDEEEEDESWRKTRLERENFLRNQKNEDLEITGENEKFLKFAKKPVVKPSPKPPSVLNVSDPRKQFSIASRRGSFLNRGEKMLSKLAELTNVSSDNPLGNVRGNRNMVFSVVSPPKENLNETSLKRKSTNDLQMNVSKKLKFTPPTSKIHGSLFEKLKMVD